MSKNDEVWIFWSAIGAAVFVIGGPALFVAWIMPGVPPPGPFG